MSDPNNISDFFPIDLHEPVGSAYQVDMRDVHLVKSALNRIGHYMPDPSIGITGIPDKALFDGIRAFQTQKGLPITGIMRPSDATVRSMERAVEDVPFATKYVWCTVGDNKVRDEHKVLEGEVFSEGSPPPEGHPGTSSNCRCWRGMYDPVRDEAGVDAIQPLPYYELLLVPGGATSIGAIKWLSSNRVNPNTSLEWTLGSHKSAEKWLNRLEKGEWLKDGMKKNIDEVLENGEKFSTPNKINKGNPATRYEFNDKFIVKDDVTNEIIQVSRPDTKPEIFK